MQTATQASSQKELFTYIHVLADVQERVLESQHGHHQSFNQPAQCHIMTPVRQYTMQ